MHGTIISFRSQLTLRLGWCRRSQAIGNVQGSPWLARRYGPTSRSRLVSATEVAGCTIGRSRIEWLEEKKKAIENQHQLQNSGSLGNKHLSHANGHLFACIWSKLSSKGSLPKCSHSKSSATETSKLLRPPPPRANVNVGPLGLSMRFDTIWYDGSMHTYSVDVYFGLP